MPTPEKQARVASLQAEVSSATGIYLSDFGGIPVAMLSQLRDRMVEAGANLEVVKNRLMKLALAGTPGERLIEYLTGPTIVAFCKGDPLAPAKIMRDFARGLAGEKQRWDIKAAYVEGRVFEGARAQALADLPPADEIKASVLGAIAGPHSSFVGTLNGALADFVFTLQAVADKRQAAGA